MAYAVEIEPALLRQLRQIGPVDQRRIGRKIDQLGDNPRPSGCEKVVGTRDAWRVRVGDYRVIYRIDYQAQVVTVTRVGHRREIYRRRLMDLMVPISEARTKLSELVRDAEDRDVILGHHGRAAAVLISAERYEALIEQLEDAYDRLSVYESMEGHADLRIPWEKAKIELGLND